jgi:hypothetical protein
MRIERLAALNNQVCTQCEDRSSHSCVNRSEWFTYLKYFDDVWDHLVAYLFFPAPTQVTRQNSSQRAARNDSFRRMMLEAGSMRRSLNIPSTPVQQCPQSTGTERRERFALREGAESDRVFHNQALIIVGHHPRLSISWPSVLPFQRRKVPRSSRRYSVV